VFPSSSSYHDNNPISSSVFTHQAEGSDRSRCWSPFRKSSISHGGAYKSSCSQEDEPKAPGHISELPASRSREPETTALKNAANTAVLWDELYWMGIICPPSTGKIDSPVLAVFRRPIYQCCDPDKSFHTKLGGREKRVDVHKFLGYLMAEVKVCLTIS
jgi:hypothetical protein